jgi:8-oxo-dGTP diphosphatase
VDVTVAAALIEKEGRLLLVRRPEGRLMGRLWELPQTPLDAGGDTDLGACLREQHGLQVRVGRLAVQARHAITFRRIRLLGYRATLRAAVPREVERFLWATPAELATLPVSSMTRKLAHGLTAPQLGLDLE